MKVAVRKVDSHKRELKFEIPKDRVSKAMEAVYQDIGRVAKVKGFRPGKAPRQVLEAEHSGLAREETLKKLIPEVYEEGLKQEKIVPLDMPEIHDVEFKDGIVTFTAHVDIRPEVKVANYKGIKVQRKSSKVSDEEINKALDYLKKSQGEGKEVSLDDAFVHALGYPSLEAFKQALARQMEIDKDNHNRRDVENQIVDALLKEAKLTLSPSIIAKQLEYRMEDFKKRWQEQGVKEEEQKKKEEELRKELPKIVERDLKVFLILDKIAELEGITVNEREHLSHKVIAFLLKEASWEEASGA